RSRIPGPSAWNSVTWWPIYSSAEYPRSSNSALFAQTIVPSSANQLKATSTFSTKPLKSRPACCGLPGQAGSVDGAAAVVPDCRGRAPSTAPLIGFCTSDDLFDNRAQFQKLRE